MSVDVSFRLKFRFAGCFADVCLVGCFAVSLDVSFSPTFHLMFRWIFWIFRCFAYYFVSFHVDRGAAA